MSLTKILVFRYSFIKLYEIGREQMIESKIVEKTMGGRYMLLYLKQSGLKLEHIKVIVSPQAN